MSITITGTLFGLILFLAICLIMEKKSHADTRCRLMFAERDVSVTARERDDARRLCLDTHHRCARCGRYIAKGKAVFRNASGHDHPLPFHSHCVLSISLKPTPGV